VRQVCDGGLCVSNREFSRRSQKSATLRDAVRLSYADPQMSNLLIALLHLAVVAAKLCGAGGVRAVMAENLLLKQQLIVVRRAGRRSQTGRGEDRAGWRSITSWSVANATSCEARPSIERPHRCMSAPYEEVRNSWPAREVTGKDRGALARLLKRGWSSTRATRRVQG
jgi:hypothetical protein